MAQGSLAPAYLRVLYRSAYAPHVMTLPVKGWSPGAGIGDLDTWDSGTIPVTDWVTDYLALAAPFFPSTVNFYGVEVFTKADEDSPSIFSGAASTDVDGSNATPGNTKAVQATWVFSGVTGKPFKIVMLDVGNNNSFEPVTLAGLSAPAIAFSNFVTADDTPLSCRQNDRPAVFRQVTYTLNAALQRQYHMN